MKPPTSKAGPLKGSERSRAHGPGIGETSPVLVKPSSGGEAPGVR